MRIDVRSEVVRSNLELLKTLISKAKKKEIQAFVETTTGSLIKPKSNIPIARNWKAVWIRWDSDTNQIEFSGAEGLKKEAEQTLSETMRTINQIFEKEKRSPEDLKNAEFFSPGSELFRMVNHGKIDRTRAEKLLKGHAVGTYLFRIDPFAVILQEELSQRFSEPIRCFTITAVAENNKIVDHTVVERLGKFQIYNDDPLLERTSYHDLEQLLKGMKTQCKIPLRRL
jgi:hypothetical protein